MITVNRYMMMQILRGMIELNVGMAVKDGIVPTGRNIPNKYSHAIRYGPHDIGGQGMFMITAYPGAGAVVLLNSLIKFSEPYSIISSAVYQKTDLGIIYFERLIRGDM